MIYDTLEIGKHIQKLRREKGLTQEQLSERLNVSTVHLAKIETGKRGCSLDILIDFAAFFNASLDYLVLGKVSDNEVRGRSGCGICCAGLPPLHTKRRRYPYEPQFS